MPTFPHSILWIPSFGQSCGLLSLLTVQSRATEPSKYGRSSRLQDPSIGDVGLPERVWRSHRPLLVPCLGAQPNCLPKEG